MSLYILKFESGGSPLKKEPRILDLGYRQVNLDDYIRKLEENVKDWIQDEMDFNKLSPMEAEALRTAYGHYIKALNEGRIVPELGGTAEVIKDDENVLKNTDPNTFDPMGNVHRFAYNMLKQVSDYKAPEVASTKLKWDPNKGISIALNRRLFGGKDVFDQNFLTLDLLGEDGKRGITERWKLIEAKLPGIENDYDLTEDLKNLVLANIAALRDAFKDNDLTENENIYLSNLGLDERYFWRGEKYEKDPEDGLTDEQKRALELLKETLNNLLKASNDEMANWNRLMELENPNLSIDFSPYNYTAFNISSIKLSEDQIGKANAYYDALIENVLLFLNETNIYRNPKYLNINIRHPEILKILPKNEEGKPSNITYTINGKKLSLVNPDWNLGQLIKFALDLNNKRNTLQKGVLRNDESEDYVRLYDSNSNRMYNSTRRDEGLLEKPSNYATYIPTNKEGGILKAEFGTSTKFAESLLRDRLKKEQELALKLEEEFKNSGKNTKELYKESQRQVGEGLTTVDYLRMGAIAADLASFVATASGVGAPVGGTLGTLGTIGDFTADAMDDAVTRSELWTNAFINAGLTAFSFVPVIGGAGKATKAITKALRYVPTIIGLIGAGSVAMDEDITKSLLKFKKAGAPDNLFSPEKWMKQNKITSDDLRNLSIAIGTVAGVTNLGIRGGRKKLTKAASDSTSDSYTIKTNKGILKISEADYKKFKEVSTVDEANAILKSITGTDDYQVLGKRNYGLVGKRTKFNQSDLAYNKGKYEYNRDNLGIIGKILMGYYGKGSQLNEFSKSILNPSDYGISHLIVKPKSERNINVKTEAPTLPRNIKTKIDNTFKGNIIDAREHAKNNVIDFNMFNNSSKYTTNIDLKSVTDYLRVKGLLKSNESAIGAVINKAGLLIFWKEGGRVPKYYEGGINNTISKADWKKHFFDEKDENDKSAFDKWIDTYNTSNYNNFNTLQNLYVTNLKNTNYKKDDKNAIYSDDVKARLISFALLANPMNLKIEELAAKGLIKRAGTTGDNANSDTPFVDGWFGEQEYLRHGGMRNLLSDEEVNTLNERLKDKDLYYYFDNNGVGKLGILSKKLSPISDKGIIGTTTPIEEVLEKIKEIKYGNLDPLVYDPNLKKHENLDQRGNNIKVDLNPDEFNTNFDNKHNLLGLERLAINLGGNKYTNDIRLQKVAPLYNSPEFSSLVTGNLPLKNEGELYGADLNSSLINYSDNSTNIALRFDVMKQAREAVRRGLLADNDAIEKSTLRALENWHKTIAGKIDTANKNRQIAAEHENMLLDQKAEYIREQTQNVHNYLTERDREVQQKKRDFEFYYKQIQDSKLKMWLDNELYSYKQNVLNATLTGNQAEIKKAQQELDKKQAELLPTISTYNNQVLSNIMGVPYTEMKFPRVKL